MPIRKQRGIEMLHCNQPLHPSSADGGVLWLERKGDPMLDVHVPCTRDY